MILVIVLVMAYYPLEGNVERIHLETLDPVLLLRLVVVVVVAVVCDRYSFFLLTLSFDALRIVLIYNHFVIEQILLVPLLLKEINM